MLEELNENIEFLRLNTLPEKLNVNIAAALLSIDGSVAKADKSFYLLAKEPQCLGVSTCYFPQNMLQCFKWDVGCFKGSFLIA